MIYYSTDTQSIKLQFHTFWVHQDLLVVVF